LSGRRHRVHSAISLIGPDGRIRQRLSTSIVAFKRLSPADIDGYLETDEWRDKAGGYAIQGRAEAWVRHLSGSYSGVVGLPLFETRALLVSAGYFHG
jgi:septum formation protein